MTEPVPEKRRKYPRVKAPKGMFVGWKSPGHHTVSRAETVGLGGLFLYTPKPLAIGSSLELLFDLTSGEVRARAVVRSSRAGKGMGVQFIQMRPEDRARLNQFLIVQQEATESVSDRQPERPVPPPKPPQAEPSGLGDDAQLERELTHLLELSEKGTHYQLLGVSPDAPSNQIKKGFYALARRFHPDHHMARGELIGSLQRLMEAATGAYRTLNDQEKRAAYDKHLAVSGAFSLHRSKTESQETLQVCIRRANECLRAKNFLGSIVWLRKCVEIAPHDAKHHALLARSLATIADYREEAIDHFQMAIEIDPFNVEVYLQFAELCEQMQLPSRAQSLYAKTLEINPVHATARERLSRLDSFEKSPKASPWGSRMFSKKGR
jgi:tetratricopeptide (TPR) repeat protein